MEALTEERQTDRSLPPIGPGEDPEQQVLAFFTNVQPADAREAEFAVGLRPAQRSVITDGHWVTTDQGIFERDSKLVLGQAPVVFRDKHTQRGALESPPPVVANLVARP